MTTVEASLTSLTLAHLTVGAARGLHVGAHAAASLLAAAAHLSHLAQVAAVVPDTQVFRQVPVESTWLAKFGEVLRTLMTLAILVLTVAVVPAAWNFRKSYKKFSDLLDRVYADINPITHHAARITENVDYVTTAIRADVQRASATLNDANARLQDAIQQAERRAQEFEALLSVVQEEAETTFVSAASAVRGVRTGVGQLRDDLAEPIPGSTRRRRRMRRRLRELADEAAEAEEGNEWPADADVVRAELPFPTIPVPPAPAAPNLPSEPVGAGEPLAAAPPETLGLVDDDELEDFYDLEDVHDGENDRLSGESPERPRVRPRRDRRG